MSGPERRWSESEIDTLVGMDRIQLDSDHMSTPPAPVKRKIMEKDPVVARPPTRDEIEQIEDQILRMAFGRVVKNIRRRTFALVFLVGVIAGFVALGVALMVLLAKAGS